ncbi:MAG TPA: competence/damage-inducible protein A [Candidatus Acidoferrum sp.]|nr:competence/damage-inducible protein A [Candidatus Acidoferrum sp.]
MTAEIICVGTELLLGNVTNTNATFLSQKLSELGINVYHHSVVGDNHTRLSELLGTALTRSELIVITGGLGPTYDDMTKEAVAQCMGLELELHPDLLEDIKAKFAGRDFPKNNERQAWFPKGAVILPNDWGTAPSCLIEKEGRTVIMLPGVPSEMKNIWNAYVTPQLQKRQEGILVSRYCRVIGVGESAMEERLEHLLKDSLNPTVAPYAGSGECMLRVTARAATQEEAFALTEPAVAAIKAKLGDCLYGVDVDSVEQVVFDLLKKAGLTAALCESCTGGLIAARITAIPGSSDVFECGLVTYSNRIKTAVAGVPEKTLAAHTAVSAETAAAMAEGALKVSGAGVALSVTGVMGPDDLPEGPVGTVYCGVAGPLGTRTVKLPMRQSRDRAYLRNLTAGRAIDFLRYYLLDLERGAK